MKYTIDGVTYDTDTPQVVEALAVRDKRNDEATAALTTERDTATAERDKATARADVADKALEEANDPKRLDSLVADRVDLVTNATRILGDEAKLDGKTDREIMITAIRHDSKDFDPEGKSDDYVRAYFEATTTSSRRHDEGGKGIGAVRSAAVASRRETKKDDKNDDTVDRNDADAAQKRMIETNRDAASKPLRFSRSN